MEVFQQRATILDDTNSRRDRRPHEYEPASKLTITTSTQRFYTGLLNLRFDVPC